jgi:phthalate 4,5-dioxygenase oxygenase subunit
MGPPELKPELPAFEWIALPDASRHLSRWIQRTNYMQGAEGEIDSSHITFLHKDFELETDNSVHRAKDLATDGAVAFSLKETPYGFYYGACRNLEGKKYWRLTNWLLPTYSLIPKAPSDRFSHGGGRVWVPIDDHHTTCFSINFRVDAALSPEEIAVFEDGQFFPPRMAKGLYTLPDGTIIDTFLPAANRENDYLIDREMQRTVNFTGIAYGREQDMAMTDGMGFIPERWREHLGTTDIAIIAARRILLRMARDLEKGIEPYAPHHGDLFKLRAIDVVSDIEDLETLLERHGDMAVSLV